MTANNRNGMRPTGRSPPFLAIGLTVALVILGFNYWSLSARNGEQANEIAVLESEMRLMNAKKISAEKRTDAVSDKVKDLESELSKQKAVVADKMAQVANIGNELDKIKGEKQGCDVEMQRCEQEKVPACLKEKEDLQLELTSVKEALEKEKNLPKDSDCDESKCSTFTKMERQKVLDEIATAIGPVPLYSLYKNGYNVGTYEEQAKQMAAQQPDSNQQNPAQPIVNQGQNLAVKVQGDDIVKEQADDKLKAQADDNVQQGQQAPNPAEQPQQGAQPPQLDQKDPNVVEQELPQVPNPNDQADPQLGEKNPQKGENDRIQPDDVKLGLLDTDDKLSQASNETLPVSENKGNSSVQASTILENSATINATKPENDVQDTNTSIPALGTEGEKANTTSTPAHGTGLDAKDMDDEMADEADDGDYDNDDNVVPDEDDQDYNEDEDDADPDQPINQDDTLRVPVRDSKVDNKGTGDNYDYQDEDLKDLYNEGDDQAGDFDTMRAQLEKDAQQ